MRSSMRSSYCHHFVKAKTKDRERKKEKQRCRCPLRLVTHHCQPGYTPVSTWLHSSLSLVTHQSQPGYTPVSAWLHSSLSLVTLQSQPGYTPVSVDVSIGATFRASLSGTFLQTLPDLVKPLKGHNLSPRICPPTRSAPSERFGY